MSQNGTTLDVRVVFRPSPKYDPYEEYVDRYTIPSSLEGELRSLGDKAPSDIEKFIKWHNAAC